MNDSPSRFTLKLPLRFRRRRRDSRATTDPNPRSELMSGGGMWGSAAIALILAVPGDDGKSLAAGQRRHLVRQLGTERDGAAAPRGNDLRGAAVEHEVAA